uniref:Uncharacterized protein n=1 Tax=Romanomermis culicivorax TaxID=13658 RepID=A0A915KM97_ROMCU
MQKKFWTFKLDEKLCNGMSQEKCNENSSLQGISFSNHQTYINEY